ncbi:hypothetical protein TNCV_1653641 [Trichonephila clavipes]|nr:hypothetical protein TNCV_1653641 [Trichonephila clavipes]
MCVPENSVQRRGGYVCPEAWRQNSVQVQGYVQCPSGRTLSNVRGMSKGLEAELCLGSGVCPVSQWQNVRENSVQVQGYVQCPSGRTLSNVRGISEAWRQNSVQVQGYVQCPRGQGYSRGLEAELCSGSGVCPVSQWQNSFQRRGLLRFRGMSSVRVVELCPTSWVCPEAWRQNSLAKIDSCANNPNNHSLSHPDNSLNTSASPLSTETHLFPTTNKFAAIPTEVQPSVLLLESAVTTSNTEPSNASKIPKSLKQSSKNRSTKVQIPEIEIKMAQHKPRKSTPQQGSSDEEMIQYNEVELVLDNFLKCNFE